MIYTIYKLINNRTGKTYTGCTKNIRQRVNDHNCSLTNNEHSNHSLQEDYNKGDRFRHEVITTAHSLQQALILEHQNIDSDTYNERTVICKVGGKTRLPKTNRKNKCRKVWLEPVNKSKAA